MMNEKLLYICHCVDTEGPLFEAPEETINRINYIFNTDLEMKEGLIESLRREEIELGGVEKKIAQALDPRLIKYLSTWDQINQMLDKAMSTDFRNKMLDSFGGGWVYNWHCLDHVGYKDNPRRRDMGFHNIFDFYQKKLKHTNSKQDRIEWHYHPMSISQRAHTQGTQYVYSPRITEILARRIIERKWFPSVNRAGFHVERPDSNWFLEQWFPYDISNQSKKRNENDYPPDAMDGRYGDWRHAPDDWSVYHPSHDDYQQKGTCRRSIGRILNIGARYDLISQAEVDSAFERADKGLPTLLAITNHDFKDICVDIEEMREYIKESEKRYPDVKYKFSNILDAFRATTDHKDENSAAFSLTSKILEKNGIPVLSVKANGKIFGPQPFLALETRNYQFLHDNFDVYIPGEEWHYYFDEWTIPFEGIKRIGVASNDPIAMVSINIHQVDNGTCETINLNS
jgi:hypothetical protein